MPGRHVNWEKISLASGLEQTSTELRRIAQYDFDAISGWLAETGPSRGKPSINSRGERRRLAWNLPDHFNLLPEEKRAKILEWVKVDAVCNAIHLS